MKAVEEAMMGEQDIFLVTQKNIEAEDPQIDDLYRIGIVAKIKQVIKMRNGIIRILVEGERRAELSGIVEQVPYLLAEVLYLEEHRQEYSGEALEGMRRAVLEAYGRYAVLNPKLDKEFMRQASETKETERLMDLIANNMPVYYEEKQKYLESVTMTAGIVIILSFNLKPLSRTEQKSRRQ